MTVLFNVIIIFCFLLFIFKVFKYSKGFFYIISLHTFFCIWLIISNAVMEVGIYNRDLEMTTYFNFSTLRLIIYELVFFLICYIFMKYKKINQYSVKYKNNKRKSKIFYFTVTMGVFIYVLYLLIDTLISGNIITNPSLRHYNYYVQYSKLPLAKVVSYFYFSVMTINGVVFTDCRYKSIKAFTIINFLMLLCTVILSGNTFGAILYATFYFFLPQIISILNSNISQNHNVWFKNLIKRNKKVLILILIAVIFISFIKIKSFNTANVFSSIVDTPFMAFLYRAFGLQATTWWGVDRIAIETGFMDIQHYNYEIKSLLGLSTSNLVGIQYLMDLILPITARNRYLWGNAELMSGYPAINIIMFGYIGGLLLLIFESILFIWIAFYIYKKLLKRQLVQIFFSIYLWVQVQKIVGISGYNYIGNVGPLIAIILLIFIELFIRIFKNKNYIR